MKQIKELNIVKEYFWNNQSSVLICMYTLCSFYSLFYTKIEKYGLDLFIFFLMVCMYDKRLIFIDS